MSPRSYQLIDPGLGLPGLALDKIIQLRGLSYLMRQIPELLAVPPGVLFELIPVQYLGDPFPAIGLYTEAPESTPDNLSELSFQIADLLEAYIQRLSINRLLEVSRNEPVSWLDVLGPHEEALRRCRFYGGAER